MCLASLCHKLATVHVHVCARLSVQVPTFDGDLNDAELHNSVFFFA